MSNHHYLSGGNSFLRELLSDDIGESVAEAIKIILEGGDNL